MLFSDQTDLRRDLLCEEGVVLLEYLISFPIVALDCPLRRCFCEMADRTEAYLRDLLFERLRAAYLASNERHKRFTFRRVTYRLFCEIRSPSRLSRSVSLMRAGRELYRDMALWECTEVGIFPLSGEGVC